MDVLLSIPLVSTIFTPSWSTSINILFFYATWSTLVLTHDAAVIHATALFVLRIFLWLIPSLLFLAFDTLFPGLAASIKFAGAASLPRRPLRLLALAVFNMLLLTATEAGLTYAFHYATSKPLFRTSTTLPLPWQVFKHVLILFSAREGLTYYTHRFLLHSNSRSPLTTLHLRYGHANPACSLNLYGDHPLPLLVLNLIPVLLPSLILRPHLLTYILFTALCTGEGTLANSGYSIVPGIFLGGIARRTAVHYASKGKANYGAWGFLDWVNGTSRGGDVLEDVKDEAEKHHLKERSSKKVDEGAGLIQDGIDALTNGTGTRRSTRKRTPRKTG
ncbi:unnamed protein product [Clonostachys byssicola]|uniref:Fatty acid hydroxylase domain-containing protein n=1 Tax=Clonostachys byssicola TaxID=160290 RepID=A0A9N9UHL8_9HYPO|nr:unnamed protein product [Clonostachys byssicola]